MWPGQDYCNPRFAQYQSVEVPFKDVIERENVPRMPWHDVHIGLRANPPLSMVTRLSAVSGRRAALTFTSEGEAARDVALNFVQRWNHHKAVNGEESYPFLHPKQTECGSLCSCLLVALTTA